MSYLYSCPSTVDHADVDTDHSNSLIPIVSSPTAAPITGVIFPGPISIIFPTGVVQPGFLISLLNCTATMAQSFLGNEYIAESEIALLAECSAVLVDRLNVDDDDIF